jgi:hypothetical protein
LAELSRQAIDLRPRLGQRFVPFGEPELCLVLLLPLALLDLYPRLSQGILHRCDLARRILLLRGPTLDSPLLEHLARLAL